MSLTTDVEGVRPMSHSRRWGGYSSSLCLLVASLTRVQGVCGYDAHAGAGKKTPPSQR